MIQLSRNVLRTIRRKFRHALGVTSSKRAPAITLRLTSGQLLIQSVSDNVAIEFRTPYDVSTTASECCLTVPQHVLRQCEGRGSDLVSFVRRDDQIIAQWVDDGIPQTVSFTASDPVEMPQTPHEYFPIEQRFLSAMAEACKTTLKESTRFALDCVQLRGQEGQIHASDSYQALIQTGFQFPWSDTILVAAPPAFDSPDFSSAERAEIGQTDDWFYIRIEQQTICLRIEKERRFPNLDLTVPTSSSAASTLQLSASDAEFLISCVNRLPGADQNHAPVTVELNGVVAIRAADEERRSPVELVLTQSRRAGDEIRFQTNRDYLSRAAQLGFHELHLRNSEAPAFCKDDHRTYLWALLDEEGSIPADDQMQRISSPVAETTVTETTKPERPKFPMSTRHISNRSQATHHANDVSETLKNNSPPTTKDPSDSESTPSLIQQAENLRDTLTKALTETRELISSLKRNQKQNRLVETTLRSLKQLEHIAN